MKRKFGLFLVMLSFYPMVIKANIVCNDGTTSPSCSTCHQGCCSRHGGCSNSFSSGSSSYTGHSGTSSSSSSSVNKKPEVVKSSDTSLKQVTIDGQDILIMDNMVYTTTKESVTVLVVANDSKATLDYQKNQNLILGENVFNIQITAENGNIKNYKLSITREKILSANKNIKIFVAGKKVTFNLFQSDIINISNDEKRLDITYELEDSNAYAEIIGNENLQIGHNEIIVRVTAENGETQDYILVVEKEETQEKKDEVQEENQVQDELQNDGDTTSVASILLGTGFLGGLSYFIYKRKKQK